MRNILSYGLGKFVLHGLHFTTALEQDKFLNFDSPWNHQNLILEASFGDNPLFLDRLCCRIRRIFVPVF